MGPYKRYLLPRLINLVMQDKATTAERARYVPLATGLESIRGKSS